MAGRSIPGTLAVAAALLLADLPLDRASGQTRECAPRDVQAVTELERHGEAQDVPAEGLAQAFWTMLRARDACREGRINALFRNGSFDIHRKRTGTVSDVAHHAGGYL
jgi:hypothetical protein